MRALAAFLVFFWHSTHAGVPVSEVGPLGMSWFEEGWTGVSLFMTLSGYLFAKIIGDRQVDYRTFLWNRFIRLAPLLAVLMVFHVFYSGFDWRQFFEGFYRWSWPGGAWSLTVEMHFYLVFPFLLLMQRRIGKRSVPILLVVSVAFRAFLWERAGSVQEPAYWSIIGHFDEFVLGMVFQRVAGFQVFRQYGGRIALVALLGLTVFWHWLNWSGGFYNLGGRYPSPSPIWIIIPTIQGLAYGVIIAGYEYAKFRMPGGLDRILARVGEVSYSTYLWHFPILTYLAKAIPFPKDLLTASVLAVALFIPMTLIATVSYEVF